MRSDKSEHILAMKLSIEDATYLARTLIKAGIFQSVAIKQDEPDQAAAAKGA
jgi:hypothetical protein